MKGINFEEWKALVKKNRQALNTKSNIYRSEPESLTWGAEKAVKTPEYGQIHTITYNVTGMEVPSDWPTEIKSGKTLSLSIPAAPYGASQTVAANVDYTYTSDVLKISNILSNITITVNIGEVLYENAKVGDYLYSDWTFGPTQKTGYLGRCIGLAEDFLDGKSRWGMIHDSATQVWCQSSAKQDTSLINYVNSDSAKTDVDGKQNTQVLLNIAGGGYDAATIAQQLFDGNGYLPAAGELFVCGNNINTIFNPNMPLWSSTECDFDFAYDYYLGTVNKNRKVYSDEIISFINLSGKPDKPINTNGHEYVDLGLPSGTLWATMNVGATSPTEYGDYYMCGMGAKTYDSTDTPYDGTEDPLDLSKDTARVVWGGDWHMPTRAQMQELTANTTYQWVTNYKGSGINGGTFTATNGAVLFIPAAGYWSNGSQGGVGVYIYYWGSSPNGSNRACYLNFDNYYGGVFDVDRNGGYSVRPVVG